MSEIIGNLTVGVVIVFCAVSAFLILWPGKSSGGRKKKD